MIAFSIVYRNLMMGNPEECETSPLDNSIAQMDSGSNKVRMKKELGLLEGVAIILGIIFGSGKPPTKLSPPKFFPDIFTEK